jgi:hypothetical protein
MRKIAKEVWLAQAINQTAPRTAQPQVDYSEWWKGAKSEDMGTSKRKRTGDFKKEANRQQGAVTQ